VTAGKNPGVFLKAIQIQGFKSFADKITLDLQPGLSVIVGPNGSGKSNAADAVRWVLGEQSAKSLRGSKMEDVIFSGSSSRRPVGMAEVSLYFDNSAGLFALDYEEVVITRRVYRDGEGQYLINKTPCRLKDIQELFLDTGSGKEGFSIIGQGRVEEMLNLKSEERRLLIEEVAGISKFRHRKKEAVRKLDDTEQNINRLNDIISEVEGRLEPLARQSEQAKASKDLNTQLEETEIKLIVNELSDVGSKLNRSQTGTEELSLKLTILNTDIAGEENTNIRRKYEVNQLDAVTQDLQAEVYSIENRVSEITHEISLTVERQSYVREQLDRLEKEIELSEETVAHSREKHSMFLEKEIILQKALLEVSNNLQKLDIRMKELRDHGGAVRLEELKSEIFEELSARSRLVNEISGLEQRRESLSRRELQLVQENLAKEEEKETLLQEIDRMEREITENDRKEAELLLKKEENIQAIGLSNKKLREIEEAYTALNRRIDQVSARHHALQTLEDNLEGYQKGTRETVLAFRRGNLRCSEFFGTVAENIDVSPKYELAVETALGSSLQNIIVGNTEDGKVCIEYLKKTNNGRATFLPLNSVRGGKLSLESKTLDHKGFVGIAKDLVKYDSRFNAVLESLLGRILIADNMDSAVELAKINNFRLRVVTLAGDQVNTGGSMTGGSVGNRGMGLLSRTREIEELNLKLKELKSDLEVKEPELGDCRKGLEKLQILKQDLESQIKACSETRGILRMDRKHRDERVNRLLEAQKIVQYELEDVHIQAQDIDKKNNDIGRMSVELDNKIKSLQNEREELEKTVQETNVQVLELTEEITAAKVEAARHEQEFTQTRQLRLEENQRLESGLTICEEKKNELDGLTNTRTELAQKQQEIEKNLEEVNSQHNEKKYNLVELRKKKEVLTAKNIKLEEALQEKHSRLRAIEQQLHQNELKTTRFQAEWEAGCARLSEEFDLSWEKALPFQTQEKKEILQEKVLLLKSEIEELGPVNYAALDEYPQALERFTFLSSQKKDLAQAANSLFELVRELDQSMIKRFEQGFKDVNEAFQEVFRKLFNGGHAELFLDDPENLLETGVGIIAQPPGKKAQMLSLLSGGERSLSAIALLFAFLKVKPSPFCLLDEIEASLDESNVKRFINYLQTLSGQTQFILISHRRGTMESADRLYGITMEESGVSKVLTVEIDNNIA